MCYYSYKPYVEDGCGVNSQNINIMKRMHSTWVNTRYLKFHWLWYSFTTDTFPQL